MSAFDSPSFEKSENSDPSSPSPTSSPSSPSQESRSSPPPPVSSSSPSFSGSSSPSPPSLEYSSPPPPPDSSSSSIPTGSNSSSSSSSPPSPDTSSSSTPGASNSSSSSSAFSPPPPSLTSPPSQPSSSESDSPSQSKPSDGGYSPPNPSKSDSSPSPPNSSASDESSSSSSSSSSPSQKNHNSNEPAPKNDQKSPLKPSQSYSPPKFSDDNQGTPDAYSSYEKPSRSTTRLSPPIRSSKASSDEGGTSTGVVASLTLVGVAVTLIAIFFVIARRKKKRMDALVDHYRPSHNFSVKSDSYYQRNDISMGHSSFSDQYYGAPPRLSNASMRGNQYGHGHYSGPDPSGSKSYFSYEELVSITNGFSSQNLIGEGGFGCVYKGALPDGKRVAVKQLKAGSGQGEREFRAEVDIISRVHHRHLVSLVGYSIFESQRLLVYDFVPNNTLEHHLHGDDLPALEWSKRLKIAIGSAKGLAYLHEDCHPRIIHRDIKSANILIDNDWEAQVADFGLAKLSNDAHTHVSTRVMGTFGYLAPEYASSGKLTDRSDVFSFGVVLLEIITGRKPVDASQPLGDESLVEWARPMLVQALETGNCDHFIDPRLENHYSKNEMFRMIEAAAACVRHSGTKRPRMAQVVRSLDCEDDAADLSNGMKFGQSQFYDSGQHSTDMQRFRRMALGTHDLSSEYGYSDEYDRRSSANSGEFYHHGRRTPPNRDFGNSWRSGEYSDETETRAMFRRPSERSGAGSHLQGGRGFP